MSISVEIVEVNEGVAALDIDMVLSNTRQRQRHIAGAISPYWASPEILAKSTILSRRTTRTWPPR
jgi:hypothetical protein